LWYEKLFIENENFLLTLEYPHAIITKLTRKNAKDFWGGKNKIKKLLTKFAPHDILSKLAPTSDNK